MKLRNKALFTLGLAALLISGAQTVSASSTEGEASNASGANDTYATAVEFSIGNPVTGYIGTQNDVDTFTFTAQNSTFAEIYIETTGWYGFSVYDPANDVTYYDNGMGLIDVPLTQGNEYYVQVFGQGDFGKQYTLSSFHFF